MILNLGCTLEFSDFFSDNQSLSPFQKILIQEVWGAAWTYVIFKSSLGESNVLLELRTIDRDESRDEQN